MVAAAEQWTEAPLTDQRFASIKRLVLQAAAEVRPLAALTPVNARQERHRLTRELARHGAPMPRWTYVPRKYDELQRALACAERTLGGDVANPLQQLYLDRVRELSLEAALCSAAGTPRIARLANERYASAEAAHVEAAAGLCEAWLGEKSAPESGELLATEADDPRSLLSRMRAAVGRLRLPFTVVLTENLAPLAATGERVILVASGRAISDEDAARTVLHEIEGHVRPRMRAYQTRSSLFHVGTARGVDDQEGRALLLEDRAGWLGARRRRQLALRHWVVGAMARGATFADVARTLVDDHGLTECEAVVAAERAFRGGNGAYAGLGRERVYLESFVRVRTHLAARPEDERVLCSGQVGIDAIEALRPFVGDDRAASLEVDGDGGPSSSAAIVVDHHPYEAIHRIARLHDRGLEFGIGGTRRAE
jgi:hypothetical protein